MRDGFKGTAIKRLDGNRIGGYGIVWGGKDLEREYFTPETDFWLDRIPPLKCLIFDHATTPLPKGVKQDTPAEFVIGKPDHFEFDEYGLWVESIIDEHEEWVGHVLDLVDKGMMGYSTDSIAHLAAVERDGWIKSWPIPAISITHHPAEPRTVVGLMKRVHDLNEMKNILAAAGAQDALKALQKEAVQASSDQQAEQHSQEKGKKHMALKVNNKALVKAFVDAHWEQIKSLLDAAKAEDVIEDDEEKQVDGGEVSVEAGVIEDVLLPVAEQVADLIPGMSEDEALAEVVDIVVENMATVEAEAIPEPATMESYMGKAQRKGVQVNLAALSKTIAGSKGAAVHSPKAGGFMVKQVNFNRNDPDKNPHQLGRLVKSVINWKTNPDDANYLRTHNKTAVKAYKAQGVDPDSAGGYLVMPERAQETIESIKAAATVAPLCRPYPMQSNKLEMPRIDVGVEAEMVAENATIPTDEVEFGMEVAYAKKIAVMLKFSDEIRSFSYEDVESVFTDEIQREFPVKLDGQILRGTGTGNQLLGLENRPQATANSRGITVTNLSGGVLRYGDLTQMQERLEDTDLQLNDSVRWLLDPKVKRIAREIEDHSQRLIFTAGGEGTQASGTVPAYLLDYQWVMSNLIVPKPKPAARKLYLCKWDEIVLGTAKQLEIRMSDEAGTSFETDQVWLRAVMHVAILVRQPEAVHILENITTSMYEETEEEA